LDVQFFPEGGYIINGFLNPIAFKAIESNGNGTSVSGKLIDELGNVVTDFESTHLGMGLFHFIPKQDKTYRALISYNGEEQRYDLPKTIQSGVLMTVSNLVDNYKIELRATPNLKIKEYLLIGKQGGIVRFKLAVNASKQENSTIVKVLKDILDEGILELTLVNQNNKPIAERLLFHEKEKGLPEANITSVKTTYEKRQSVIFEITLDSLDHTNIAADMSLSVSNLVVNAAENSAIDIRTYLLLNSAVRGKIEQPGYYFYSKDSERQQHLDVLMRTQGWRQYVLDDVLVKSSNYFLPEKGITLSGKVVDAMKPTDALTGSVSLTANSSAEMIQDRAKTAADGTFSFNNLNFTDNTNVLLSANVYYPKKKRNPTLNYKILLDSIPSPPIRGIRNIASPYEMSLNRSSYKSMGKFTTKYEEAEQTTLTFLYNNKTIQLDEAFIAAKKKKKEPSKYEVKRKIAIYKTPSQTVDFEGFAEMGFTNLLDALRGRVPGLTVRGTGTGTGFVYLRAASSLGDAFSSSEGAGSALILLDGVPVGGDILNQMLPSNVDFIDVIKGPKAAIFGSRGANGVVAVYTKNGTESSGVITNNSGSLNFEYPGFSNSRSFYVPKYSSDQVTNSDMDIRTTLHWQPFVELNTKGKCTVSFYVGDISGVYKVVLEGITSDGTPVHHNMNFTIE
jgi:hypothetical protein